ncbi:MAG: hypothetical protein H7263_13040 [Candidatus Sericytochromatia bacterium]|nr:hypothetical protein [Candidatus Sericytochromatia bacterium]
MNKSEKFEIFQKLNSLFTYSDLLPDEFKSKYLEDLELLKNKISEIKDSSNNIDSPKINTQPLKPISISGSNPLLDKTIDEENNPSKPVQSSIRPFNDGSDSVREIKSPSIGGGIKSSLKPPMPPSPPNTINSFTDFKKNITSLQNSAKTVDSEKIIKQSTDKTSAITIKGSSFELVTSLLIPKLTDKGKTMINDLSLPIDEYLILKLIDGKSSLYKLFQSYNNTHNSSFTEFANTLYTLDIERTISFIKTEATVKDLGIIKLEDLISEGKVISELNMNKAIEYQKAHTGSILGKTLVELKFLSETNLGFCLKIQKWVSRMFEKAEYVKQESTQIIVDIPKIDKQTNTALAFNQPSQINNVIPAQIINPQIIEEKPVSPMLDLIIPIFNQKGRGIISDPDNQQLANRLRIIDEKSSLLDTYWKHRESFKNSKTSFLKLVLKLASQEILEYKTNSQIDEKIVWVRIGELMVNLDLIDQSQIEQALEYVQTNQDVNYIGEALVKLGFVDENTLDDALKIQTWYNELLASISYERPFVDAIKSVLKDSFKCLVDIGSLRKVAFPNPLKDIVYISYNIDGKLKGRVFYISDRAFMQQLANTLMNSVGNSSDESLEFDESYVATVCTVIISNSLSKLSQMGLFSSSDIPKIIMEKEVNMNKEIIVADKNTISMIPLINDFGRFAIGLEVEEI